MKKVFAMSLVLAALAACQNQNGGASTGANQTNTGSSMHSTGSSTSAAAAPASPQVDALLPGDEKAEAAHNHKGENDSTGDWSERTYRHAESGWFSWDFKVIPNQPNDLVITYWGSDERTFDIQIDGQKLVTEHVANDHPEEFFEKTHTLPAALIGNKQKITVKFLSPDSFAGGVFGVKIMRPGSTAKPAAK